MTGSPPRRTAPTVIRGLGLDAVDVERFRQVLTRRPLMAERVFTESERADARRMGDAGPPLAARFAAKEAVMKALGVGIGAFAFRDVEVERSERGAPSLVLAGKAAALARIAGVTRWHVSLTHTELVAMASVIGEGAGSGES